MHARDGSGSGGIVSQMKASIESKAKAAATSPSRPGAPNSTKQKINVSCITRKNSAQKQGVGKNHVKRPFVVDRQTGPAARRLSCL